MRATLLAISLLMVSAIGVVRAAEVGDVAPDGQAPVPRVTIYPKTIIRPAMLEWAPTASMRDATGEEPLTIDEIIGKSARRTLLPGRAVHASDIGPPITVKPGSNVDLEFEAPGVVVTARGVALEEGGVGSRIRFRNVESGLIAVGVILANGRINVSLQ